MVGLSFTPREPHEHHRDALTLELFDLAAVIALDAAATELLRGKGGGRGTTGRRGARA
jgi:hypothetical protein